MLGVSCRGGVVVVVVVVRGTADGSQTHKARGTSMAKSELSAKSWWGIYPFMLGGYPRRWTLTPPPTLYSTQGWLLRARLDVAGRGC